MNQRKNLVNADQNKGESKKKKDHHFQTKEVSRKKGCAQEKSDRLIRPPKKQIKEIKSLPKKGGEKKDGRGSIKDNVARRGVCSTAREGVLNPLVFTKHQNRKTRGQKDFRSE